MGSGKTTVMAEASDLLAARGVPHAAIDVDMLGMVFAAGVNATALTYRNLAAVWANFAAAGVSRLLLAQAIESRDDLERIRTTLGAGAMAVCRLTASVDTMRSRVRQREPGMLQSTFVARVVELNDRLDAAGVEDFSLENDGRSVTEVARELLARTGWLEPDPK
jgi:hypothetical protein